MESKINQPAPKSTASVKPGTKRLHIQKANTVIFTSVIIASVIVAIALVSLNFLFKQFQYNQKVINAENKTVGILKQNTKSVDNLKATLPSLNTSNVNEQKIFNAMPPIYDYTALASAMDKLASDSGVVLQGGVGQDESASVQGSSNNPQPVQVALNLSAQGSYQAIKTYVQNLERSIRPITIQSMQLSGSNTSMQAQITAVTYYQPTKTLQTSQETIK